MKLQSIKVAAIVAILILLLAACANAGDPAETVESYLEALAAKDANLLISLSCVDYEADAQREADALQTVDSRLENVSCSETNRDGDTTLVECTGQMVMTYQGEDRPLDLSARVYELRSEGGEWRICGYR